MKDEEICKLICKDESRKSRRECFSFVGGDCATIRNCKGLLDFQEQETLKRVGKAIRELREDYANMWDLGWQVYKWAESFERGETPEGWEE